MSSGSRQMPPLLYPERSAAETIRGYMTQVQWSVLRWLGLSAAEVLLCEGDEDIDRYLFDERGDLVEITQEQFKDLTNRITARTPAVYESVFNFLRSFYEHHKAGRQCSFIFTTSASAAKQRTSKSTSTSSDLGATDLAVDILQEWMMLGTGTDSGASQIDPLALWESIKSLVNNYVIDPADPKNQTLSVALRTHAEKVREAVTYLNGDNSRWTKFLSSVVWSLENSKSVAVKQELTAAIRADSRLEGLPSELVAERLIVAVFETSSQSVPGLRVLTREHLSLVAQTTEDELAAWAARARPELLTVWADLINSRLEEHERRILALEHESSPKAQRARVVSDNLSKLGNPRTYTQNKERSWMYFRPRVIQGLFLSPRDFERNLALFSRRPDVIAQLFESLSQASLRLLQASNSVVTLVSDEDMRQRLSLATVKLQESIEDLLTAQRAGNPAETIRRLMETLDQHVQEAARTIEDVAASEEGASAGRLTHVLRGLQGWGITARRSVATGWILSSPAGRGKSNFLWEVAGRLVDSGEAVCLLTGRDLDGRSSIEQIISKELGLIWHDDGSFEDLIRAYGESTGRPVFVLIDAVNEARADLTAVANQLSGFMARHNLSSGLHLLASCRDLFWSTAFMPALGGLLDHVVIDTEDNVAPVLNGEALTLYFRHFKVGNVEPRDLYEWEWAQNPLFVRVFCETYTGADYAGPKPIRLNSFDLIEGYFRRKQDELHHRGFPVISLLDSLTDLAADLVRSGRNLSDQPSAPRFAVAESVAREALGVTSMSNELLFDALIDMDLVLRFDLDRSVRRYVGFTFERFQDFFVARATLRDVEDGTLTLDDTLLQRIPQSSALTDAALGTLLAMSMEYGTIDSLSNLSALGQRSLSVVLDLVSPDVLSFFEDDLSVVAQTTEGISSILSYATNQIQAQRSARRSFVETFGLSLLGRVLVSFSLYERHFHFYINSEFFDALTDVLELEIGEMRDWVRRGFGKFPKDVDASLGRVRAVIFLLGSNSPHVRNSAHEWLFWVGCFKPTEVCGCLEPFLDEVDLFIRERTLALVYGLLRRRPELRTAMIADSVFNKVLDKHSVSYTPHYLIVEFGRKILLEFGGDIRTQLSADQWKCVEHPPRNASQKATWTGSSPEWTRRGPIDGDQSRYTFGSRFRPFPVPRDEAVQEALTLLPTLGYDPNKYQALDDLIVDRHSGPRIWDRSSGRRYERFGKSYAHVASWIVMGMWAETKPIASDVVDPVKPFSLDQPEYDYLFTVRVLESATGQWPTFDFPESITAQAWEMHDEHQYLREFTNQYPDEVVVWARLDRTKPGRKLTALIRSALLLPEYARAYRWAGRVRQEAREEFFGHLSEEELDESFEFHNLRDAAVKLPQLDDETPAIAAYSNYVRTMNDEDYSILTISPRLIRSLDLVQLETEGEFTDQSGRTVVRQVKWGSYSDPYNGHAVLMSREVFDRCLSRLNVSFAHLYFTRLVSVDDHGRYDDKMNIAKWGINFPGEEIQDPPEAIGTLLYQWEKQNHPLSGEQLVKCMHIGETQGEDAVRSYLLEVETSRQAGPDFSMVPEGTLREMLETFQRRSKADKKRVSRKPKRRKK